jgi:hypothetical protein
MLAALAFSLILPGAKYASDMNGLPPEMTSFKQQVVGVGIPPLASMVLIGLVLGPTLNAIGGLGEEIGWRGFLYKELGSLGFWRCSLVTGVLWALWHVPLFFEGYGDSEHPRAHGPHNIYHGPPTATLRRLQWKPHSENALVPGHCGQPANMTVEEVPFPLHSQVPSGQRHEIEQPLPRSVVAHPASVTTVPPLPSPEHVAPELPGVPPLPLPLPALLLPLLLEAPTPLELADVSEPPELPELLPLRPSAPLSNGAKVAPSTIRVSRGAVLPPHARTAISRLPRAMCRMGRGLTRSGPSANHRKSMPQESPATESMTSNA